MSFAFESRSVEELIFVILRVSFGRPREGIVLLRERDVPFSRSSEISQIVKIVSSTVNSMLLVINNSVCPLLRHKGFDFVIAHTKNTIYKTWWSMKSMKSCLMIHVHCNNGMMMNKRNNKILFVNIIFILLFLHVIWSKLVKMFEIWNLSLEKINICLLYKNMTMTQPK